jgi:hypothetical protein
MIEHFNGIIYLIVFIAHFLGCGNLCLSNDN